MQGADILVVVMKLSEKKDERRGIGYMTLDVQQVVRE
jgi:hypothetical protein